MSVRGYLSSSRKQTKWLLKFFNDNLSFTIFVVVVVLKRTIIKYISHPTLVFLWLLLFLSVPDK